MNIPQVVTFAPNENMDWLIGYTDLSFKEERDKTIIYCRQIFSILTGCPAMLVNYKIAINTLLTEPPFVVEGGIDWFYQLQNKNIYESIAAAVDLQIESENNKLTPEQQKYWAGEGTRLIPTTTVAEQNNREISCIIEVKFPDILKEYYPNMQTVYLLKFKKSLDKKR